jgi:hypothetical protein|uniref:DUF1015 domain-containing protein n=1 Tax=Eutreptiella gymnastica TaxID=73025 RepID=A0A7S4D220_9EUGL
MSGNPLTPDEEFLVEKAVPQLVNELVLQVLRTRPSNVLESCIKFLNSKRLASIGLGVPEIMLPKAGTDMTKWAVIACDQYTSEPEYWDKVVKIVGDAASTYNMILPEVFLETPKESAVIESVKAKMAEYMKTDILVKQKPGFVLLDRKTGVVPSRKGLMVALDLEHYSYEKGSTTLMRATEGTILSRLPPRVKVREAASVELPHIMVLIDDPDCSVIEPLFNQKLKKVYDFDLMCNGGHLTGYAVDEQYQIEQIAAAIARLADPEVYAKKYNIPVPDKDKILLYAMGDGNHSFATAKLHWEKTKEKAEDKQAIMDHPARYALVELVNIHDAGLEFEGIHRVVFNAPADHLFQSMKDWFASRGIALTTETCGSVQDAIKAAERSTPEAHKLAYATPAGPGVMTVTKPTKNLETATLQEFLDAYLADNKGSKIDYVHGVNATATLAGKKDNVGFFCPTIDKSSFFRTIIMDGAFPRKTFSMGESDEKRFYVEVRKIVP